MPLTGSPTVLAIIVSLSGLLALAVFVIVVFVVRSWKRRRNIEKITSAPGKLTKQQQSEEVWIGSAVEKTSLEKYLLKIRIILTPHMTTWSHHINTKD